MTNKEKRKRKITRMTVDQRIACRARANVANGKEPNWADHALDFYLDGEYSVSDICGAYHVTRTAFYNAISRAALYRLMKAANVEHLDEVAELAPAAPTEDQEAKRRDLDAAARKLTGMK